MTSLIFIIVEKYFKHNNASKSNMNYKNSVRKIFRKGETALVKKNKLNDATHSLA
jgi:hypothetical protein